MPNTHQTISDIGHTMSSDFEWFGGACVAACTDGFTIPNSPTVCGAADMTCDYACDPGYEPEGAHECGPDGWFRGGSCVNIDECSSWPCQNGGNCVDGVDEYECQCLGDWEGLECDECPAAAEPCTGMGR